MKNYARKASSKYRRNEEKAEIQSKGQRKSTRLLEAFQAVKKVFNIDVYNCESKKDEYSIISICDTLSENSNTLHHNRRSKRLVPESVKRDTFKGKQSNDNAILGTKKANVERPKYEVTVLTTSEVSDKLKSARLEKDAKKKQKEKKPYFICCKCETIVPRAVGVKCQKLPCDKCRNQMFHSKEFLMIHKAKSHWNEEEKDSELDNDTYILNTNEYDEISEKKDSLPIEKPKSCKKNKTGKYKKCTSARSNSTVLRFKDDIASKLTKLLHGLNRSNYSSGMGQKDNSNKQRCKHVPFQWLNDDECDITETSMPSPCTLSSQTHFYAARARQKLEKKKNREKEEVMKQKKKSASENVCNIEKTTPVQDLIAGDSVSMTKQKCVSMKFICDHPSLDKKRLAITNNIKLRVVDSPVTYEPLVECPKVEAEKCEEVQRKSSKKKKQRSNSVAKMKNVNNSVSHKHQTTSARTIQRNDNNSRRIPNPQPTAPGKHFPQTSSHSTFPQSEAPVSQKHQTTSPRTIQRNDNNSRCIPNPQPTAPGKHFPQTSSHSTFPQSEALRSSFRPSFLGGSNTQSRMPPFGPSNKPPFLNDQFFQGSLKPTLYNYNHRELVCMDGDCVPKLPWSIMARRMETHKKRNEPPALKYFHSDNSPVPEFQDSSAPELPPRLPPRPNRPNANKQPPVEIATENCGFVVPENQHRNASNSSHQHVTGRMKNWDRARMTAQNIDRQFPRLST